MLRSQQFHCVTSQNFKRANALFGKCSAFVKLATFFFLKQDIYSCKLSANVAKWRIYFLQGQDFILL